MKEYLAMEASDLGRRLEILLEKVGYRDMFFIILVSAFRLEMNDSTE
jgi:hypothetical protein